MTFTSHSSSVPLFHFLQSGTMEHVRNQRNIEWNTSRTLSLKVLAIKALERNEERNKRETKDLKSVPPMPQSSSACGTNTEVDCKAEADDLLYKFNERAAILEYEGGFMREEAERLARTTIEEQHRIQASTTACNPKTNPLS